MEEGRPVKIISDNAEERVERVGFGFESYIKTISQLIANKENETPMVIGIYGQWGSGKTTLMKNIQAHLKDHNNFPGGYYRRCKTVWFQPWKYDKEEEILAALVIFIDDLDRCPKERIKRVLETIKLFMDRRGCIFVIGASRDIVKRALEKDYRADAEHFMEKMVQVTFNLPYILKEEFEAFIKERRDDIPREFDAHLPLLLPAMKNNPRRLKRFINDTNLQHGLWNRKGTGKFFNLGLWNRKGTLIRG
jgi:predicted KAP-like P-loop ATPase